MPARTSTDGKPFYCKLCGLGYGEYMACDDTDCELESLADALARVPSSRPKGTLPFYYALPSGAGTATLHLPESATAEDVKALSAFVFTTDERRLAVTADYQKSK